MELGGKVNSKHSQAKEKVVDSLTLATTLRFYPSLKNSEKRDVSFLQVQLRFGIPALTAREAVSTVDRLACLPIE